MADMANGILVTNINPRSGPGKAGMCVLRKDGKLYVTIRGVKKIVTLTDVNPTIISAPVVAVTLTAAQSGRTVTANSLASIVFTLPPPAFNLTYSYVSRLATTSGIGNSIVQGDGVSKVYGQTAAGVPWVAAATKGVVDTQATAAIGDRITLWSDGTDWYVTSIGGIWARSA